MLQQLHSLTHVRHPIRQSHPTISTLSQKDITLCLRMLQMNLIVRFLPTIQRRRIKLTHLNNTHNQKTLDIAFLSKRKLDRINIAFSKIHEHISTTEPMADDRATKIEQKIVDYMTLYCKCFPQKVLPKHHILEHHCATFIKKHRFGLGLLREQKGELLHSTIRKIQKRTHAMTDEASQLKTTMQLHLLQTSQQVQSLIPPKRKKKSNKKHYSWP